MKTTGSVARYHKVSKSTLPIDGQNIRKKNKNRLKICTAK